MSAKLTRRTAVVEMADERILTVRVTNPDKLRYEEHALRQGWNNVNMNGEVLGGAYNARGETYETWAALKRTGQYDGTYEQFAGRDCLAITVDEEEVDPTQPGPGSGSSPKSPGTGAVPSSSSSKPTTP